MSTASVHAWRFFRAGGFDQVRLDTGADLLALPQLDQKLWVALACPTTGLNFDARTLTLIDTDKDGRVRAGELLAAVTWTGSLIKDPNSLIRQSQSLPLDQINDTTPEGKTLLASARTVLAGLGKSGATEISVADTTDTARIFAQTFFNGDGVIVEESASDDATKAAIRDLLATVGSDPDRSGKPGLNQARVDAFFKDAAALDAWQKTAEAGAETILPLGDATAGAVAATRAVRAKIDDFFARCRLAGFDARAIPALNREEKDYLAITVKELTADAAAVSSFPLATVAPGRNLPLTTGVNPAWSAAVAAFVKAAVTPILGERTELTEADWAAVNARLAAHEAWLAAKPASVTEKLGLPRLRELLGNGTQAKLTALIAQDKALEGEASAIANVDKLVRFHRDLHRLCTNFVNFKDFYDGGEPAIFQCGTLYLDQRSCQLCLPVEDAGRHAAMAGMAGSYLAYVDCIRRGSSEKMQIVAAFTDGDSDNLMVGRNGVFYDRKGRDWDATITKIIDNPISIRQAFWAPYKKLVRLIEEQIAKRAAAADAESNQKLTAAAQTVAEADKAAKDAKAAEAKKFDVGAVAAIGVAFGSISTFLATVFAKFVELDFNNMVLVVVGLVLVISGPSVLIAYLKLRKRNLGPILDANGWAVNSKARVNVPFGATLTQVAKLPPGAQRDLVDPYAEKQSPWPRVAAFVAVLWIAYSILNGLGFIHDWTNGRMGVKKEAPHKAGAAGGTNAVPAAPAAAAAAAAPAAKP